MYIPAMEIMIRLQYNNKKMLVIYIRYTLTI